MGKLGFYFNSDSCIGCHSCSVACKDRHDLEVGVLFRKVTSFETGEYPKPAMYHLSMSCNHCENPACVAACVSGAMFVCEDGTVQHDDTICDGCQNCVLACPYSQPKFLETLGVVHKCDSCKPLRDAGMNPVCVDACPQRVLEFGDLDELKAKYGDNLVNKMAPMPEPITAPSLLIKAKECAFDDDFDQIIL